MTTETQTYANERDYRDAMKRTDQRHIDGWRAISTSNTTRTITWTNDPDAPPTAEQLRIKELIVKIRNDTITERELVEYTRLTL